MILGCFILEHLPKCDFGDCHSQRNDHVPDGRNGIEILHTLSAIWITPDDFL
jgi:hypothetical protein